MYQDTHNVLIPYGCCLTDVGVRALKGKECRYRWAPNKPVEALHCYGTTSLEHPAVQMIAMERGKYYLGAPTPPCLSDRHCT